jgi:SlyX protein
MTLEERVAELEMRQAFQDDIIQTLNDVIVEQQKSLDRVRLQLAELARRQAEMMVQQGGVEDEAPPPHY